MNLMNRAGLKLEEAKMALLFSFKVYICRDHAWS